MANVNLVYGLNRNYRFLNGSSVFTTLAINGTFSYLKYGFTAEETDTITHLGFRYAITTGTPPTYRISLREFVGTGTGTILGGGSPASATFTPPSGTSWNSTYQYIALTNPYTCFKGQKLMIVIDYSSGTINASNNSSFTSGNTAIGMSANNVFPRTQNSSDVLVGAVPVFSYKSATRTYGHPLLNISTVAQTASISRIAARFSVPVGAISSYKVGGIYAQFSAIDASGDTFKLGLWDSSSTLQSTTFYSDVKGSNTSRLIYRYFFPTNSLVSLTPGTTYYIGAEYVSGSFMSTPTYVYNASSDRMAENVADVCVGTYSSSTWSADTTSIPMIYPIITEIN